MVTAHFMFLAAFPLPTRLPQDLSNSRLKMEKLHDSAKLFWSLTETNPPSSTFFNANFSPGAPACFVGLHVRMSRTQRNEAVKQMLLENGATTLNDTIRQNA